MTESTMEYKIFDIISKALGFEGLDENYEQYYDVPLFGNESGFGLDSVDILEVIIAVMKEFDVAIGSEDTEIIKSVRSIAAYVKKEKEKGSSLS